MGSKNILGPFYEQLINDQILQLGTCIDEYFGFKGSPNHKEEAEEIIHTGLNIRSVFFEFLWKALLWNKMTATPRVRAFIKLPLSKMPLYIIEYPDEIKKQALCPPPIPGRGPLYWQVIFSRWRLLIGF